MPKLAITKNLSIDQNELDYSFARASGPGSQMPNKVKWGSVRFDVRRSPSLETDTKLRLEKTRR